jgi:nucleotide-binding universal stress UspA family protein
MPPVILFATDFSESSENALPVATAMAVSRHGRLLIAHVSELDRRPVGELFDDVPDLDEDPPPNPHISARLEDVIPTDDDVPYEHRMLFGKPAEAIVQLAADEDVDLIVLGTHGRRGLRSVLAGGVAKEVIRHAPCPVVAVRLPQKTFGKKPVPVAAPMRSRR